MRIYTAASYGQRERILRDVWPLLIADGHEMTARWVVGAEETTTEARAGAELDVADVERAECLILFTNTRGTLATGGGQHVEMGYALCLQRHGIEGGGSMRRVVVVGDHEHIFCHAYGVEVYATLDEARSALR